MIELPDPEDIENVADWIEFIVAKSREPVSKTFVSRVIERSSGLDPQDAFLDIVWQELTYREKLYSNNFFHTQNDLVEPGANEPTSEYLTCLFLSIYGNAGNSQVPGKLFERITCEAIERYLTGSAIVFGWPFQPVPIEGNETLLAQHIMHLANDICERFVEAPKSRYKDRGIDVIGWIPHEDRRSGQTIILLQCGAGKNWKGKNPVPIEVWKEFIHWAHPPVYGFAIPCIVDDDVWHDISKDKGILFDRVRLMNLLKGGINDAALNQELATWVLQQAGVHEQDLAL